MQWGRRVIDTYTAARAAILTIALALAACGGGGGGGGGNTNPPPPEPPAPPPAATAPTIVTQPGNQTIDDGDTASFAVTANGTAPLTYQWRRNGSAITGATLDTYSFVATHPADNGAAFSVVVTNSAGSATSTAATLQVLAIAPAIATQPLPQQISVGSTATFSVSATGSAPLTYQWRRDGVAIPGATNNSYVGGPYVLGDSGALFDVAITNPAGTVISETALLTVSAVGTPPSIVKQPLDAQAPVGGRVAFVVIAAGTAPFTYQWNRNGTPIPNETGATLLVSPVSGLNDDDSYTATVTNVAGSATSDAATLTVASQSGQIDLVAGLIGGVGSVDGVGGNAHFRAPADVAVDSSGNLFIADGGNATVRKMTPAGVTTTLAGSPQRRDYIDGVGADARFRTLHSIAVDTAGNVFVADSNAIRKIALDGTVTTFAGAEEDGYADGTGTDARFHLLATPQRGQMTIGPNGDLFVADCGNHVIRRVTPSGVVSTYAGGANQSGTANGPVDDARFNCPSAIVFDADEAMYVVDSGGRSIRKIEADVVSTLADQADGLLTLVDLTVDSAGNVFVIDSKTIKRVTPAGVTTTVAGALAAVATDGTGTAAGFGQPSGIGVDGTDNLYIADTPIHAIRKVTPTYVVTTLPSALGQAGYTGYVDGSAASALFDTPMRVTASDDGTIYVADSLNCAIRKIDGANVVSTLVGEPAEGRAACETDPTTIDQPRAITLDDDTLYAAPYSDDYVAAISDTGVTTTVAGLPGTSGFLDGVGAGARFSSITGLAHDGNGNVYVSDSGNNAIRKIDLATGEVTTLAGSQQAGSADGVGAAARFSGPCGIEADSAGNVYVADCGNHTIRKIDSAGTVTTIAGVAGASGYVDGDASAARFFIPADVALDDNGNLYVADQANNVIRKITPAGSVTTVAGTAGLGGQGQSLGPLPASLTSPVGIHARSLGGSQVELIVTGGNSVVRITTP